MNSSLASFLSTPRLSLSPSDTQKLAQDLTPHLQPGSILALSGPLGAGKTLFTQSLASSIGITSNVPSPTFTLHRQYQAKSITLHHLDLYRLKSASEATSIGLFELFDTPDSLIVIEWPEIISAYLPLHTLHLNFLINDSTSRTITITTTST